MAFLSFLECLFKLSILQTVKLSSAGDEQGQPQQEGPGLPWCAREHLTALAASHCALYISFHRELPCLKEHFRFQTRRFVSPFNFKCLQDRNGNLLLSSRRTTSPQP